MGKFTPFKFFIYTLSFFLLLAFNQANAQVVIGEPNLDFTSACANAAFNTFTTSFVYSPEAGLGSSNSFLVVLSDSNGDFSNSSIIYTSTPGAINTSPVSIDFSIPTSASGEAYKIRIKTTAPEGQSAASQSFPAYYKIQDSPFTINGLQGNAFFCQGSEYLLTIDNPGENGNNSPLNFPWLTFNWFKVVTPTTSVLVGQSPSLLVSEEGVYFVETNYGSCTSNSFSNRVTVSTASTGDIVTTTINSSLGNPFCIESGMTTLSTLQGNSHRWFRDGVQIPEATSATYLTSVSGAYVVIVDFGNCEATGAIDLETGDFSSELNIPINNILEEGDSLEVNVSTSAMSPTFEWYLEDELIDTALGNIFSATQFGNYRVAITQTLGCLFTQELFFQIEEFEELFPDVENIPNIVSPNGDGINDTWMIPAKYVSGTNTEILILSNRGKTVLQTTDYLNNWPNESLQSSGTNQIFYYIIIPQNEKPQKGSITILK